MRVGTWTTTPQSSGSCCLKCLWESGPNLALLRCMPFPMRFLQACAAGLSTASWVPACEAHACQLGKANSLSCSLVDHSTGQKMKGIPEALLVNFVSCSDSCTLRCVGTYNNATTFHVATISEKAVLRIFLRAASSHQQASARMHG